MLCSDFKKDYASSFLVESCPSTSVTEFFLLQSLWCKQGIECGEVHASGGRVDFSCFETSLVSRSTLFEPVSAFNEHGLSVIQGIVPTT